MTITDTNVVLVADQTKCKSSVNTKRPYDKCHRLCYLLLDFMRLSFLFQHNLLCRVKTASANSTFLLPTGEEHTDLTKNMREIINFPACFSTSLSPFIFLYFGLWLIAALTGRTFRLQFGGLSGHRYVLM